MKSGGARKIVLLGNRALRVPSNAVANGDRHKAIGVAHDLLDVLLQHPGWALSAPQINEPLRLFVMATPRLKRPLPTLTKNKRKLPGISSALHYTAIVNPTLTEVSREVEADHEACLSAPGLAALVPRHVWVSATFSTLDGDKHAIRLSGHPARVFQHELDHLDGITFLERTLAPSDIMMEEELNRRTESDPEAAQRAAEQQEAHFQRYL